MPILQMWILGDRAHSLHGIECWRPSLRAHRRLLLSEVWRHWSQSWLSWTWYPLLRTHRRSWLMKPRLWWSYSLVKSKTLCALRGIKAWCIGWLTHPWNTRSWWLAHPWSKLRRLLVHSLTKRRRGPMHSRGKLRWGLIHIRKSLWRGITSSHG